MAAIEDLKMIVTVMSISISSGVLGIKRVIVNSNTDIVMNTEHPVMSTQFFDRFLCYVMV